MCDKSEPKQKCQKGQCDSIDPMLSQKKIKLEKSDKHMHNKPKPQYKQQENHFDSMDFILSQKKVKPEKSKIFCGGNFEVGTLTQGQATELTNQCLGKEFNRKTDQGEHSLSGDFSSKSNLESSKESCSSLSFGPSSDLSLTSESQ